MNAESTMAMSASDCWDRLRQTTIGRLAVITDNAPDIFPVNYAVEHSSIVLRTGDGTKVEAIAANPQVAFEIDGLDPAPEGTESSGGSESGGGPESGGASTVGDAPGAVAWSVVLRGEAKEITRPEELQDTVDLDVSPLQSGTKNHFIRIVAEAVTGRRFPVTEASTWQTSLSRVPRAAKE
ncbi:MAG: pyridoxamine 5'-phosphate oxidase family protein [Brevibacterium sp.]